MVTRRSPIGGGTADSLEELLLRKGDNTPDFYDKLDGES